MYTSDGLISLAPYYNKLDICDDCAEVASDHGIYEGAQWSDSDHCIKCVACKAMPLSFAEKVEEDAWQAQVDFMVELGGVVAYHACSAKTEPDLDIQCDCGCELTPTRTP